MTTSWTSTDRSSTASINPARSLSLRPYFQLTKPTIGLLVVMTAVPSLIMATGEIPSLTLVVATLLGTFLASASAGVLNHLVDGEVDTFMARTKSRPIPSGKVSRPKALLFAFALGTSAIVLLLKLASPLAAAVALAGILFYVLVYTMFLKPRTPQNIVIGGAAGAVGPLIGWAAASGSLQWPAWVLFSIIFLWTPPHFWALALKYKDDYARASIPMLPVVKGSEETRRQIMLYTFTLIPAVFSLWLFGAAGDLFLMVAFASTGYFSWLAVCLYRDHSNRQAMRLFHYSCFYLFVIFGGLTLDRAFQAVLQGF